MVDISFDIGQPVLDTCDADKENNPSIQVNDHLSPQCILPTANGRKKDNQYDDIGVQHFIGEPRDAMPENEEFSDHEEENDEGVDDNVQENEISDKDGRQSSSSLELNSIEVEHENNSTDEEDSEWNIEGRTTIHGNTTEDFSNFSFVGEAGDDLYEIEVQRGSENKCYNDQEKDVNKPEVDFDVDFNDATSYHGDPNLRPRSNGGNDYEVEKPNEPNDYFFHTPLDRKIILKCGICLEQKNYSSAL